ncbi:fimbrial protein [Citrobacter braakii]|uniref:fimbrial protein n=1 Tax=Citrobacter braakii TaxID=57706 RepID=UPI0039771E3F
MLSLNQKRGLAGLILFSAAGSCAATPLQSCFSSPGIYTTHIEQDVVAANNLSGMTHNAGHIVSAGGPITANCRCPSNMPIDSGATVYSISFAGSPLPSGASREGVGFLTEKLDVKLAGYPDAINHQDGNNMVNIDITDYTPNRTMKKYADANTKSTESQQSVCSDETRPVGASTVKRQFQWNVIAATFYLKKPVFGEEIFQPQTVVENYACLYYGSSNNPNGCTVPEKVSEIRLGGVLRAPLSCTINAGSQIEVEFPVLTTSAFTTPGVPPANGIKSVDISYHCDNPATDNQDKIKMTLTADHGNSGSDGYIAKMLGRDDIGVRMYDDNDTAVKLDGSFDFPITLDEQGNGVIKMTAAPVSTTERKPVAGKYEGNVTVKMDIK